MGCSTIHGTGAPDGVPAYLLATRSATVPPSQSTKLAWYEGDIRNENNLVVLAPRGWVCAALIAADGGWSITVSPPGTNPASFTAAPAREVSSDGSYNGPGASTACDYFASAQSTSPVPRECATPIGMSLSLKSNHLVDFQQPPNKQNGAAATRGFLLWYPNDGNAAVGVDCRLPSGQASLCQTILGEALPRLRAGLVAVPATTTPAPPAQSTAVANGLLASPSNGVLFIQWTRTGETVRGTVSEAYTNLNDPTHPTVESHSFSGVISGHSVTLTLDDGTNWNGTLSGKDVTLSLPANDGTLQPFTFSPGTVTEYNAALAQVQARAQAAAQTQTEEQQQTNNEQTLDNGPQVLPPISPTSAMLGIRSKQMSLPERKPW